MFLKLADTLLSILLWVAVWGLANTVIHLAYPNPSYNGLLKIYISLTVIVLILIYIVNGELRLRSTTL